ncbi:MAG: gamma-glutamyltransferase family protein [Paracoccaceae bacterium]
MRPLILVALLIALPLASFAQRAEPEAATAAPGQPPKPLARAERQMIVTANPHATEAGLAMLRAGGSAVDATIAALLVLNVVEPQSSGLGGGAFALVHGAEGLESWDARETAPLSATDALFLEDGAPMPWSVAQTTGRAIGVPGLAPLLERLHARHGRLPWDTLFEPAIRLAAEGFAVSPRLAALVARAPELFDATARAVFLPDGRPIAAGETLRQPVLAATLEAIAQTGAAAVTSPGPIRAAILAVVRAEPSPGALTAGDFDAYRVIERVPVCHGYRAAWRVCGMGPPSSGATTVGQILTLVGGAPPAEDPGDPALWHRFAEASKLAYADRARYLGDPDQVAVPVAGLLDPGYLEARGALIDDSRAMASPAAAGTPPGATDLAPATSDTSPGTTHVSAIDADGLAVAVTASIESAFGTGRMAAGLLLNNQLTDFSFVPRGEDGRPIANAPGPGKRPRSSMAPTIVYARGSAVPSVVLGSPGGSRIPEYVAGALIGMLDLGLDPAEAAALFHVSQRNREDTVLETGAAPEELGAALVGLGHAVATFEMTSGLGILRRGPAGLEGGADPRREGVAAGD